MGPGLGESASGPLTYDSLCPLTNLWKILGIPLAKHETPQRDWLPALSLETPLLWITDNLLGHAQPQCWKVLCNPGSSDLSNFSPHIVLLLGTLEEKYAPNLTCDPVTSEVSLASNREPQKDQTYGLVHTCHNPHINDFSHPPPPTPASLTCLLEDMLVSVLMLLVSVTTIADGNREVWEYWGGSCLCVYTGETEWRQSQDADHMGVCTSHTIPHHRPCVSG